MLSELYIENLAVIEKATIDFSDKLNVFTGETGAGKSILINGINAILGQRVTKKVKFVELDIEISKLTMGQVNEVQTKARALAETPDGDNMELLVMVVKFGAQELSDVSDEEFLNFPLDELTKLSTAIMQFSGLNTDKK